MNYQDELDRNQRLLDQAQQLMMLYTNGMSADRSMSSYEFEPFKAKANELVKAIRVPE